MGLREGIEIEQADEPGDEERLVRDWRYEQFSRLGFEHFRAMLLAHCDHVDLGQVRQLVRRGCTLDTLLRIVI